MEPPALFISAGDPSGDNAAARVLRILKEHDSSIRIVGLGGKQLAALGQTQLADPNRLAVMGFWEVAKNFLFFRSLFKNCLKEIDRIHPKAVLLIDYPGFNLRLAKKIKKRGIPVIYYISPQVWAWGEKRLEEMKKNINRLLLILPFEQKFFDSTGIPTDYVGHYLTEDIPTDLLASPLPDNHTIALLPGSRPSEIERILPSFLDAITDLAVDKNLRFVLAGISDRFDYDAYLKDYPMIEVVYDRPRDVIHDARIVITASGTATLETALIGRPMVVVYKTGGITYQIAKRVIKLDKIALANLVLEEKVVPELIQDEATGKTIAAEVTRYLTEPDYITAVKEKLDQTQSRLGGGQVSQKVANIVMEYIG